MPRMSSKKFGDEANSIRRTLNLEDADPRLARLFYKNMKQYQWETMQMEMWARSGFVSGYEVLSDYD